MLKLFEFSGVETDWIAAKDEDEARRFLKGHAGINDEDIALSYETVREINPAELELLTDEYDEEEEETVTTTAAEVMAGKTKPFLVCSTYYE